jgi:hypothetical protein
MNKQHREQNMEGMLACLRGWHPGLALAELTALLPDATLHPEASERWVRVSGAEEADSAPHK